MVDTGRKRSSLRGLGWATGWDEGVTASRKFIHRVPHRVALCAVAGLLCVSADVAQRSVGPQPVPPVLGPMSSPEIFPDSGPTHFNSPIFPPLAGATDVSGEVGHLVDSESCNSWTESGVLSPTVSAKRLQIPGKAMGEFQKGCGAFKGKHIAEAEDHLRKAIDFYPDYAAAWVVLGQVLNTESKVDEGNTACSKATEIDPKYVASYLCLAEFAATKTDWPAVSKFSNLALAIDPLGNPYSLYYAADAGLHQNQLSQAEMHAQAAVKLDEWHHLPELHLLLAQIYEAAGNVVGETTQLKEFLKVSANSKDAVRAKSMLTVLLATAAPTTPAAPKATSPSAAPGK